LHSIAGFPAVDFSNNRLLFDARAASKIVCIGDIRKLKTQVFSSGEIVLFGNSSVAQVSIFKKEGNDFGGNFIEMDHLQTINLALIAFLPA